jgi:hypothetical protein
LLLPLQVMQLMLGAALAAQHSRPAFHQQQWQLPLD